MVVVVVEEEVVVVVVVVEVVVTALTVTVDWVWLGAWRESPRYDALTT